MGYYLKTPEKMQKRNYFCDFFFLDFWTFLPWL